MRRLYARELAVFPPPGLSADDSWFARTDPSRPGRLYVGYLAPALDQRRCLAPLPAALLHAPLAVFQNQQDRNDLLEAWWTQVIYHGSLRGVGNSHNTFATSVRDLVRRFDREHRQAIRDGGGSDSESTADPEWSDAGEAAGLRQNVVQLTSFSSPQRNARTFDQLQRRRGEPDCLDAVLATNMISVGVDVDRLAAMVINGQPLTTRRVRPGQQPNRSRRRPGPRCRQLLPPPGTQPLPLRELPPLPRVLSTGSWSRPA